jgi:hypothetical protein
MKLMIMEETKQSQHQLITIIENSLTILEYLETKCIVNFLISSSELLAYNRISGEILLRILNEGLALNTCMSKFNIVPSCTSMRGYCYKFSHNSNFLWDYQSAFLVAISEWFGSIKDMKKMMMIGKKELTCCLTNLNSSDDGTTDEHGMTRSVLEYLPLSSSLKLLVLRNVVRTCYDIGRGNSYTIFPLSCDKCNRGITTTP